MTRLLPTQKKSRTTRCKNVLTVWNNGRKIHTARVRLSYTMTLHLTHSDSDKYIPMAERVLLEACSITDSPTNRLLYCWILFTGGAYTHRLIEKSFYIKAFKVVRRKSFMAPLVGLEPTTYRLTAERSTNWAKEEYINLATTYFLSRVTHKYLRHIRAWLLCSVWEQVFPLCYHHQKSLYTFQNLY